MKKIFNEFIFAVNLGSIDCISDSSRDIFGATLTKKRCYRRNEDNCVLVQQQDTAIRIHRPKINWNSFRKQIIGLTNEDSATCYINAAFQCLASTPPLVDWLFDQLNACK